MSPSSGNLFALSFGISNLLKIKKAPNKWRPFFVRFFGFNYVALCGAMTSCRRGIVERAMGFEPTTSCLGSKHSTPELRPLVIEGEHSIYL